MKLRDGARKAPLWSSKMEAEGSRRDFRADIGIQTLKKNGGLGKRDDKTKTESDRNRTKLKEKGIEEREKQRDGE